MLNIVSSSFVRDAEKSLESSRGGGQSEDDSDSGKLCSFLSPF